jgi:hypothetical protein
LGVVGQDGSCRCPRDPLVQALPDLAGRVRQTTPLVPGDQHATRGDTDERRDS